MYKQQAKSSHNEQCRWIMHGAESSDSDHWNAPLSKHRRVQAPGAGDTVEPWRCLDKGGGGVQLSCGPPATDSI